MPKLEFDKTFEDGEVAFQLGRIYLGPVKGRQFHGRLMLMPNGEIQLILSEGAEGYVRFIKRHEDLFLHGAL